MSAPISKEDLLFLRNYSYVKGGLIPLDNLLESHAALLSQVARLREGLTTLTNQATKFTVGCNCQPASADDALSGAIESARALLAETEQP